MEENTKALCEEQRNHLAELRASDESTVDLVITSYYAGYKQGQAMAEAAQAQKQQPA